MSISFSPQQLEDFFTDDVIEVVINKLGISKVFMSPYDMMPEIKDANQDVFYSVVALIASYQEWYGFSFTGGVLKSFNKEEQKKCDELRGRIKASRNKLKGLLDIK